MVDNVFNISRNHSLLYLCKPVLDSLGIFNAEDLIKVMRKQNNFKTESRKGVNLTDIISLMYEKIELNKNVGKYKKYLLREEKVLDSFLDIDIFGRDGKIPIFINGICMVDNMNFQKKGIDPYSNFHFFSNNLIKDVPSLFSKGIYENFEFIYVQPLVYIQQMKERNEKFMLVDFLDDYTQAYINPKIKGVGFGNLNKMDSSRLFIDNSQFNLALFDIKEIEKGLRNFPDLYKQELDSSDYNFREFLSKKKYEIYINRELMSIKYAIIVDLISKKNFEFMQNLDLSNIKLFMEKTSFSADIMSNVNYYLSVFGKNNVPFSYIGGDQGIFQKKGLLLKGICDESALNRLYGYMGAVFNDKNRPESQTGRKGKKKDNRVKMDFVNSQKYPFLLIERELENKKPNFEDVCDSYLEQEDVGVAKDMLEETKKYSYMYRVGTKRIEPRLVELLNQDIIGYEDFRVFTKQSFNFYERHKNKSKITANQINGFFDMAVINTDNKKKSDFRGSLFVLKTTPSITEKWVENAYKGNIDVGCCIESLINDMTDKAIYDVLKKEGQDISEFSKKNNLPLIALRGTFLHEISSMDLEGLAHYETLSKAGFKPTKTRNYAETAFNYKLDNISVGFHPDCYFFLEKDGKYDLVVMDKKTNRRTAYPEHKYLLQTFFYGWSIKKAMKEELGIEINNIYCVLDKMAFYTGFDNQEIFNPVHARYREQSFSPIICFGKDHFLNDLIWDFVKKKVTEKKIIENDLEYLKNYRRNNMNMKKCNCYSQTKVICDYIFNLYDIKLINKIFKK
jgi:hypothetical protein